MIGVTIEREQSTLLRAHVLANLGIPGAERWQVRRRARGLGCCLSCSCRCFWAHILADLRVPRTDWRRCFRPRRLGRDGFVAFEEGRAVDMNAGHDSDE